MTPEQLAKSGTEHAEQTALFCWANMASSFGFEVANNMQAYSALNKVCDALPLERQNGIPELKWLHAIPNAGARGNKIAAAQLKAEGVKAGVADMLLPVRRIHVERSVWPNVNTCYSGMYLEMKRANGSLSNVTKEQTDFMVFVKDQGYYWNVAFGWRMAADMIQRYLECR